MTFTTYTP